MQPDVADPAGRETWFGLKLALLTGIYPPDIGGPATHSFDLARELQRRGHQVTTLTLSDSRKTVRAAGTVRFPRRWPWWLRDAAAILWLVRNRKRYDVIYSTGLHEAAAAGARLSRRPAVLKVVGDPAWERGKRLGLARASFEDFQAGLGKGLRLDAMRSMRNWAFRNATRIVAPSRYLAEVVRAWVGPSQMIQVIPNGVAIKPTEKPRGEAGPGESPEDAGDLRVLFVGRLVDHKRVEVLLEAVSITPGVSLDLIGEGPDFQRLRGYADALGLNGKVRFRGSVEHARVLEELGGADAVVLASSYEGLPHVAVEALASGTPLIAPAVGGIPEVLEDEETGLVVSEATPQAFSKAMSRLRDDPGLRGRLSDGAKKAGRQWTFEVCASQIESLLREVAFRGKVSTDRKAARPTAIFVGKGGLSASPEGLARKLGIMARYTSPTVVAMQGGAEASPPAGVRVVAFPRLQPKLLESGIFYAFGPLLALALALRRRISARPAGLICQSPYEALGVVAIRKLMPPRMRVPIVVEVHGDWRLASTMYGGEGRRVSARWADRAAAWSIAQADLVRTVGAYTERLVRSSGYRGPVERFAAFSDYESFLADPPCPFPDAPNVLFVGAFEEVKGPDLLLEAWSHVLEEVPDAHLAMVGSGPMLPACKRLAEKAGIAASVRFWGQLAQRSVIERLDGACLVVSPSRSEGLPRTVLEAFCRCRPVVGSDVGGTGELIQHGEYGLLVQPGDARALSDGIVKLLRDRERLSRMGRQARNFAMARNPLSDFEAGIARIAHWIEEFDANRSSG